MMKLFVKISKKSDETALNAMYISKVSLKANIQRNDVVSTYTVMSKKKSIHSCFYVFKVVFYILKAVYGI